MASDQAQVKLISLVKGHEVPSNVFSIPLTLRRLGVSEVINSLRKMTAESSGESPPPTTPYDVLVGGIFLRTTLAAHLATHLPTLSVSESVIDITYQPALQPPTPQPHIQEDEWIGAVLGSPVGSTVPWFVSGSADGSARVYSSEAPEGGPLCLIEGLSAGISALGWTSLPTLNEGGSAVGAFVAGMKDGSMIAHSVAGNDADTAVSKPLWSAGSHGGSVNSIDVSPNGKLFASGAWDSKVMLWTCAVPGREGVVDEDGVVHEFGGGSDQEDGDDDDDDDESKRSNKRRRGDSGSGKIKNKTPIATLSGHSAAVSAVSWADVGTVWSGSWDHSLRSWDVQTGVEKSSMSGPQVVTCLDVQVKEDGGSGLIVTGGPDNVVRVWDPRNAAESANLVTATLHSHSQWVSGVRWLPGSSYHFASISYDKTVKVWDVRARVPLATIAGEKAKRGKLFGVDWHLGETVIAGGEDGRVRLTSCPGLLKGTSPPPGN